MISLLVRLSWGSLYSVYLSRTRSMSVLAYWNSLLELVKRINAISTSHNTLNSYAFFIRPNLRFVNVTCSGKGNSESTCFMVELGRYRYLESVSVFGIGILKYLGIRYRYRYFWNTGWKSQIFGIPHLYLALLLSVTPSEFPYGGVKFKGVGKSCNLRPISRHTS